MAIEEVGAVSAVVRSEGRFLLVMRRHAPSNGLFAFPGGKIEEGETSEEAVRRELLEETGLTAGKLLNLKEIMLPGDGRRSYRLKVFHVTEVDGNLRAGDDADNVGWYTLEEMRALPITESTLAVAEEIVATSLS